MELATHPKKRKPCFTLIELLVVVSIIAILAAMLLPALGKAKEKVRVSQCHHNMKQFYLGFVLYAEDWNDLIAMDDAGASVSVNPVPGGPLETAQKASPRYWCNKIYDYVNDQRLFYCPLSHNVWYEDWLTFAKADLPQYGKVPWNPPECNYALNSTMRMYANVYHMERVPRPSTTMLLGHPEMVDPDNFNIRHTMAEKASWWDQFHPGPKQLEMGDFGTIATLVPPGGFLLFDGQVLEMKFSEVQANKDMSQAQGRYRYKYFQPN